MKHLTLNIPDNLELEERETKRFLAAKMYEIGKLSLGQAADLADMSKVAFAEILADYDISLINYPPSDLSRVIQGVEQRRRVSVNRFAGALGIRL